MKERPFKLEATEHVYVLTHTARGRQPLRMLENEGVIMDAKSPSPREHRGVWTQRTAKGRAGLIASGMYR